MSSLPQVGISEFWLGPKSHLNTFDMFIEALTVSFYYSDYLEICAEENARHLDHWVIVTHPDDKKTIDICSRYDNITLVYYDIDPSKAVSDKHKPINEGFLFCNKKGWILILDSDIVLPSNFRSNIESEKLDERKLYLAHRNLLRNKEEWDRYGHGGGNTPYRQEDIIKGLGYFQLVHCSSKKVFNEKRQHLYPARDNYKAVDTLFSKRWPEKKRTVLDMKVSHLGPPETNYKGRVSLDFSVDSEPKLYLGDRQATFKQHRCGWEYVIDHLHSLGTPNGVLFDGFMEKTFSWEYSEMVRRDEIPIREPWVGVMHNPPNIPTWFDGEYAPSKLLRRKETLESLESCKGIYVLSNHLKNWLVSELDNLGFSGLPVETFYHPTSIPELKFDPTLFKENKDRYIVQVGWWLRKLNSIRQLRTNYKKAWIAPNEKAKYLSKVEVVEENIDPKTFTGHFEKWEWLSHGEYDRVFSQNVIFLNVYDSSANNAIIEAIARNTPILANRHPAIEEYIGDDYPMLFDDLDHASDILSNERNILNAHEYFKGMDKSFLTPKRMIEDITTGEIYNRL